MPSNNRILASGPSSRAGDYTSHKEPVIPRPSRLQLCIRLLLLGTLLIPTACATRDEIAYRETLSIGTESAYASFLGDFPDSRFRSEAEDRLDGLQRLREAREREREKLSRVNAERLELLNSYEVGITKEEVFLRDGWNVTDPADGKIGILQYFPDGESTTYEFGALDLSPGIRQTAKSMFTAAWVSVQHGTPTIIAIRGIDLPSAVVFRVVFEDGILMRKQRVDNEAQ
jgi:hypothetical protein